MSQTTIYIKGNPGFKPALITKLGRTWMRGAKDVEGDVVSFSLPENVELEEFKTSIGESIISDFNILFFNEKPSDLQSDSQMTYIPGRQIKMSIWASKGSTLSAGKTTIPAEKE